MTTTKYITLTLIALVSASFVISMSGIDPLLDSFLAGGLVANAVRVGVLILLVALLVTDPPRSHKLRALFGVSSVVLLGMCASQLFTYSTFVIDAFIYLELAVIFAIEALEFTPQHISSRKLATR